MTKIAIAKIENSDKITADQAFKVFSKENPKYNVKSVKQSSGAWIGFLVEKTAEFPNKEMDMEVDSVDDAMPPPSDDNMLPPPSDLDSPHEESEEEIISSLRDLIQQVEEKLNALDGGPEDELGSLEDPFGGEEVGEKPPVSISEPIDENITPDVITQSDRGSRMSSVQLEREKEGLTLTSALSEIEEEILSQKDLKGFKVASIRELDDKFFVTLEKDATE